MFRRIPAARTNVSASCRRTRQCFSCASFLRAQLLDIHLGVAVPLVRVRVRVALEISKANALRSASATSYPDRCISSRSAHRFAGLALARRRARPLARLPGQAHPRSTALELAPALRRSRLSKLVRWSQLPQPVAFTGCVRIRLPIAVRYKDRACANRGAGFAAGENWRFQSREPSSGDPALSGADAKTAGRS
jgi:hypothetical protein